MGELDSGYLSSSGGCITPLRYVPFPAADDFHASALDLDHPRGIEIEKVGSGGKDIWRVRFPHRFL